MLQFSGAYLIRSFTLRKTLFKDFDLSAQQENGLKYEFKNMKESQEVDETLLTLFNKSITYLEKVLMESHNSLQKMEQERCSLQTYQKSLETSLKNQSAQHETGLGGLKKDLDETRIEGLLVGDDGFEKAKAQVSYLYPELDLSGLYWT